MSGRAGVAAKVDVADVDMSGRVGVTGEFSAA